MKVRQVAMSVGLAAGLFLITSHASAGLVAHWKADGNGLDSSGNGHHASWSGTPAYVAGQAGQAFSLDGSNNFLSVPGNAVLEPTQISISLWFKTPDLAGDRLLIDSNHGSSNGQKGWAIQMNGLSGKVGFAYGNGSSFPEVASPGSLEDDTLHHLVATLDNSNMMRLYIDGVAGTPLAYSGTPTGTGLGLRFGRHFSLNRQYTGLLDDIRLFDHALSQSEVDGLFAVPEPTGWVVAIGLVIGLIGSRRRHP